MKETEAKSSSTSARPEKAEEFEAWNDSMVAKYDPDLFHRNPGRLVGWVEKKRVAAVLGLLKTETESSVLEVGCGAGNLLAKNPSKNRTGVDLSEVLLERARKNCGPDVTLKKANAEELPFEESSFDRVYCTEVLEHVMHPEKVVIEIKRVIKPDGRIVLSIPEDRTIENTKKWLKRLGLFRLFLGNSEAGQYQPPDENDWHLHHLNLKKLREITEKHLNEEKVVRLPSRLFPVHYVAAYTPKK